MRWAPAVNAQVVAGVVLGRNWRPMYRRSQHPGKFWAVVAVQNAMLLVFGITWLRKW